MQGEGVRDRGKTVSLDRHGFPKSTPEHKRFWGVSGSVLRLEFGGLRLITPRAAVNRGRFRV